MRGLGMVLLMLLGGCATGRAHRAPDLQLYFRGGGAGAFDVGEALELMDRAALKRSWSGPLKFNALGLGVAGVYLLGAGDRAFTEAGLVTLGGAVINALIGVLLDSRARADVREAIQSLHRMNRSLADSRHSASPARPPVVLPSLPARTGKLPPSQAGRVPPPSPPVAPEGAWYWLVGGQEWGPLTLAEIREAIAKGEIPARGIVRKEGKGGWDTVSSFAELRDALEPEDEGPADESDGADTSGPVSPGPAATDPGETERKDGQR